MAASPETLTPRGRVALRPGLRTRMVVYFSLATFIGVVILSIVTFAATRNYLVNKATSSARDQAIANAQLVRTLVGANRVDAGEFVTDLRTQPGGYAVLHLGEENLFYAQAPLRFTQSNLPTTFVRDALAGVSGVQRVDFRGRPYEAVAIHVPAIDATYFEVFPIDDVADTLGTIRSTLVVAVLAITVVAGVLGFLFSGSVLVPLRRVTEAATTIAGGSLATRLEPEIDPDLQRLVASFNGMADAVQERIEREERFASDVSHELRSPITSLGAAVEVLKGRAEELSERNRQALDIIATQVRRFDRTVLDLLELSRLDARAGQDNQEELHLAALVERIASRHGYGSILVVSDLGSEDTVYLDRRRVERILLNLLDNARDHAGGASEILLSSDDDGNYLLIVDDNGPGIGVSERLRIFERFARGTGSRNSVGSGLGLAIVAEHALALGGRAYVDTSPSGGARFVVVIPARGTP
ncbi:MAG: HAMP domain-containing histidine kinase [Actinobacteria bacterium]|nr:HAMP domain-containing histidine kinase [Actinomycetota bacterium]